MAYMASRQPIGNREAALLAVSFRKRKKARGIMNAAPPPSPPGVLTTGGGGGGGDEGRY